MVVDIFKYCRLINIYLDTQHYLYCFHYYKKKNHREKDMHVIAVFPKKHYFVAK